MGPEDRDSNAWEMGLFLQLSLLLFFHCARVRRERGIKKEKKRRPNLICYTVSSHHPMCLGGERNGIQEFKKMTEIKK